MKSLLRLPVAVLASMAFVNLAHADDVFVGATISKSYSTALKFSDGQNSVNFESNNKPVPYKLYGGYNFTNNYGIELGYKNFGTSNIGPVVSNINQFRSKTDAFYIAGKGSLALDESWSVFGKLGVALTRSNFVGTGELNPLNGDDNKSRLYAGAGVAYNINKNIALTLELEHFGEAKSKGLNFGMNGLAAGVKLSF